MSSPTYFERLRASVQARGSLLCVGLDPEPDRIEGGAAGAARHCTGVVEETIEFASAYKPNLAFWEQYGPDGWRALADVRASVPADVPVIIDAKRGDIPSTMRAYARALFDVLQADAVTVNPYLGSDSVEVFTERADRGTYVVTRTSNPAAPDLQHLDVGGRPLYVEVGRLATRLNSHANVGLVVGATAPHELAETRRAFPHLPFLIPGVGAQGGDLEASLDAGWNGDVASCLVAVSRSVLYADRPAEAARQLRDRMRVFTGSSA